MVEIIKNHDMKNLKPILLILLTGILTNCYAWNKDSMLKRQHFEVSFGQSLLFISNSKQINIRNQAAVVIPTNAVLFFAEFRPQKKKKHCQTAKKKRYDRKMCTHTLVRFRSSNRNN